MGSKRNYRPTMWPKPLLIVCIALSLALPLFYFEYVDMDLFIVSKDERQVSNDESRTPALRKASDSSHPFYLYSSLQATGTVVSAKTVSIHSDERAMLRRDSFHVFAH
jgi:hypothetical protein